MSEQAKHTPGPWNLLCSEARGGPRCLVVCPKDNEIASINPFRESWNEDAELIAAAPEMLEALIAINEATNPFFEDDPTKLHRARVAVQKAIEKATKHE